jgi:hypothetical protein
LAAVLLLAGQGAAPIPAGSGRIEVAVNGTRFEVFTYKPASFTDGPLILVFHGVLRDADAYRDHAAALGDRFGALVAAPRFDAARFPSAKYQQGGLLAGGKVLPREEWTWGLVPGLADALRGRAGRPGLPCYLVGHSAGGQFLARLAGFTEAGARRVVVANPGSHLFPSGDAPYPYGFGGLPEGLRGDKALRAYLAQPLTIYLGTADTEHDGYLDRGKHASRQGESRYRRGLNAFRAAERLATSKGWPFNWRLVEAQGVGHDARDMFAHPNCGAALFGEGRASRPTTGPSPAQAVGQAPEPVGSRLARPGAPPPAVVSARPATTGSRPGP